LSSTLEQNFEFSVKKIIIFFLAMLTIAMCAKLLPCHNLLEINVWAIINR
jgi:hypothetical protein